MRNGHSSPILTPPGAQAARVYGQIPATRGGSLTFSVCFTLLYLWAFVGHAFAWWARVLCLGFYVVWAVLAYGSKRNTAYLAQQEEIQVHFSEVCIFFMGIMCVIIFLVLVATEDA